MSLLWRGKLPTCALTVAAHISQDTLFHLIFFFRTSRCLIDACFTIFTYILCKLNTVCKIHLAISTSWWLTHGITGITPQTNHAKCCLPCIITSTPYRAHWLLVLVSQGEKLLYILLQTTLYHSLIHVSSLAGSIFLVRIEAELKELILVLCHPPSEIIGKCELGIHSSYLSVILFRRKFFQLLLVSTDACDMTHITRDSAH